VTTVTAPTPSPGDDSKEQASTLDRRRDKAQAAKDAADAVRAGLAELDAKLKAGLALAKQHQDAFRRAQVELTRLKKQLKVAAKDNDKLTAARKKAKAALAKVEVRAKTAETRYDEVVLADIVRREKDRDRAASAKPPVPSRAPGKATKPAAEKAPVPATAAIAATPVAPVKAAAARTRTTRSRTPAAGTPAAQRPAAQRPAAQRPAAQMPAPEKPDAGTATATGTAARKTAATARSTATARRTPARGGTPANPS
jgi:hypothetical protein